MRRGRRFNCRSRRSYCAEIQYIPSHTLPNSYGLELTQAAGVVGLASDAQVEKLQGSSSASGRTENPFDNGPGGVNATATSSSNMAPGFDPTAATCLLTCMFREEFANLIARSTSVNMCGRSLVGQSLHNLSLPSAQMDR